MPLFVHEYYDTPSTKNIENGWWEYDKETGRVYNRAGGWHIFHAHPMQEFKECDWEDILAMTIRNDDLQTGWIAPNGEWFGCETTDHEKLARYYLKTTERDLEEKGWIKVTEIPAFLRIQDPETFPNRLEYFFLNPYGFITKMQENTLFEKGLELSKFDREHHLMS